MRRSKDLQGQKFGRWTVIQRDPNNRMKWLCKCNCGKEKSVWQSNLTSGKTLSCGCLISETTVKKNYRHGGTKDRLYQVWCNMRRRCTDKKNNRYKNYGGRGISVCKEWQDYSTFKSWAYSNGYDETAKYGDCTIERIDVNKGYYPANCTWKTIKEQCNNRTSNRLLTFNGKTQNIAGWANETGYKRDIIENRLKKGWSVERTLITPPGGRYGIRTADKSIH